MSHEPENSSNYGREEEGEEIALTFSSTSVRRDRKQRIVGRERHSELRVGQTGNYPETGVMGEQRIHFLEADSWPGTIFGLPVSASYQRVSRPVNNKQKAGA